jgi:hypothetical protein
MVYWESFIAFTYVESFKSYTFYALFLFWCIIYKSVIMTLFLRIQEAWA